jgi:translation initiation factor 5A
MVSKVIDATEMRVGTFLMIDGIAYQVKKMDISKTGKHGHAKVRFESVSIVSGKKKVGVVPGHDKFEVPMIIKKQGQVLSVLDEKASLMDSESFESLELAVPEDLKGEVSEGKTVEYWDVEGEKLIKRVL